MEQRKKLDTPDNPDKAWRRGVFSQMQWGWQKLNNRRRSWFKMLLPCALLVSLCAAIWLGGPVGEVKVDPIHYAPFHEIGMVPFLGYALGALVLAVLLVWWRSDVFMLTSHEEKELPTRKDRIYSALRCLQMTLLHLLVFGIPIGVAAWLTFGVSFWFALLLLLACLLLLPTLCMASCRYMWTEATYREALRYAFSATFHYWGRTFLFLIGSLCVALALTFVVVLPAAILVLVVYDAQTAVAMGETVGLPWGVKWAEYLFLFLGMFVTLFIFLWMRTSLEGHYLTIEALIARRKQAEAEALRYEEEQKRLKRFTRTTERKLNAKERI